MRHCIGVDPYYLTYKSKVAGYNPEVAPSRQKNNNSMACWITKKVMNQMNHLNLKINGAKILTTGINIQRELS